MTLGSTARTQGIFPSCGIRLVPSSLPGEMAGGVADPIFLTAGPRGFPPTEVVTSGLDSPHSRMLREPAESFVVGEV